MNTKNRTIWEPAVVPTMPLRHAADPSLADGESTSPAFSGLHTGDDFLSDADFSYRLRDKSCDQDVGLFYFCRDHH